MARMSARERDLHRKHTKETHAEVSRSQNGRKRVFEIARANPGVVVRGAGAAMFVTPESEVENHDDTTMVKLTKKESVSGAMISNVTWLLSVDERDEPRVVDEVRRGFREGEEMRDMFASFVPNFETRQDVSLPVEVAVSLGDVLDEHGLSHGGDDK